MKFIHTLDLFTGFFALEMQKCGKIPTKSWIAITKHAKTCVIDDHRLYSYHTAEQPLVLLFNSIYNLVGVTFDGQNHRSPATLTPSEKVCVNILI